MDQLRPGIDFIAITTSFFCIDDQGRLLMHKRSQNCRDEQGMWDCGGGQLEFGETPEEGVIREVKEEYSCDGDIIRSLPPISVFREINGVKTHWVSLPFIIKINPEDVVIGEVEKIDEIGWFTLDTIPRPVHSALDKYYLKTDKLDILKEYIK